MSEQTTNKHKVIIKNGVAGVEISGRLYTHTISSGHYYRKLDTDAYAGHSHYASPEDGGFEIVGAYPDDCLIPIPNPALEWPAGTKVMVRDDDDCAWTERVFREDRNYCTFCAGYFMPFRQCKLAEAE